jgi:aminoglycoside phosphotransferase (APT) family kinase protein
MTATMAASEAAIVVSLERLGLLKPGDPVVMTPLAGGVSSDIWRVQLTTGPVCVKRALPRLKVRQVWEAPVERNRFEWLWLQTVSNFSPESVPRLIADSPPDQLFVMEYLDPIHHPVWKSELCASRIDTQFAAQVGRALARIHAFTANRADLAEQFSTDSFFHALRLEPYLEATARRHPDRADALLGLASITASTRRALVHGDISPKNILVGPRGPVFLDAECAWFGDPAFDLAFCLNHLLLKCLWIPASAPRYLESFAALASAYLDAVTWEDRQAIESRVAALLPGLLLARVDGKSPVEYLTEEVQREVVRRVARELLGSPVPMLSDVSNAWKTEIRT